jgi:hypothetical protein
METATAAEDTATGAGVASKEDGVAIEADMLEMLEAAYAELAEGYDDASRIVDAKLKEAKRTLKVLEKERVRAAPELERVLASTSSTTSGSGL